MKFVLRIAIWLYVATLSYDALAHQIFLSSARVTQNPDRQIAVEVKAEGADLQKVFNIPLTIRGGIVNPHVLAKHKTKITEYLMSNLAVANGEGDSCELVSQKSYEQFQAVSLDTKWDCKKVEGELFYQTSLFFDLSPNAGQLVFITGMKNKTPPLLNVKTPKISITVAPPAFMETVTRFVASGIEHIFLGYDHIAFLIALLLWARRIWPVIKVVTAFTIAHTITLTLATLDVVALPSVFVEGAIAATIIYVAAENFFHREIEKRWFVTFVLGLVHGFGFASVLKKFGLPEDGLVTALATFNIGVEIGQIAIVGICLPIILAIDRFVVRNAPYGPVKRRNPIFVYISSTIILMLGLYWFVDRVFLS